MFYYFFSKPNKRVFYLFTFLPSQPNTYERKSNFFYPPSPHFLSSHFFTLPTKKKKVTVQRHMGMCNLSLYLIKTTPNNS